MDGSISSRTRLGSGSIEDVLRACAWFVGLSTSISPFKHEIYKACGHLIIHGSHSDRDGCATQHESSFRSPICLKVQTGIVIVLKPF
jgi:hypothetical protein